MTSPVDPDQPAPRPERPERPERQLRQRARRVVRPEGPPTVPIAIRGSLSGLTADEERRVLDMVLRTGEAMVATGAPVADVTAALLRLAAGFGVTRCQVDITFISIIASIDRDDDPITKVRVINVRTSDYSRLADLFDLVDAAHERKVTLEEAERRLDEVLDAPHPYRRWIVTLALGLMAAGVALLLNGGWLVALVAAATTMLIDRILRMLRRKGLPYLFQQVIGAAIATVVGLAALWAADRFGWSPTLLPPSLIVASGIVVLLAGLSLVGSAEDAIAGYPLTAAARTYEVVLHTIGLVVGIGVMLDLGQRVGIPLTIADPDTLSIPTTIQIISGGMIAGAWGLASYTRARTVPVVVVAGMVAAGVLLLARDLLELGTVASSFLAALVVGLFAGGISERLRTPNLVISVCGITPLLPGLAIYKAMFAMVDSDDIVGGTGMLIGAFATALALAAGVTLGEYLATPLRSEMDRWQRRVNRRARGART
ncbi:threonine/serine ThrE exporter family protein [Jiangella asiatica]|uniref:Threonine/serine exporter family protein n=1 Tax=Jiangella asiatica TaxID=2530372 RepID=A0A4R5CM72_9ACTN|nr:threonine/serine exporter family protein [Jiangella asiatica]TDE00320.1 threonine/serine exporter family protein [Jiangella asiatica]